MIYYKIFVLIPFIDRIESYEYTNSQLYLATIFFTAMIFLFPTIAFNYMVFASVFIILNTLISPNGQSTYLPIHLQNISAPIWRVLYYLYSYLASIQDHKLSYFKLVLLDHWIVH